MTACASASKNAAAQHEIINITPQELLVRTKESAGRAELATNSDDQKTWALHGVSVAEQCLMRAPEEPGCYYYRAVNTGLYHKVKIIGYQHGVKQMISDCEKVIEFDRKYDHGGAYRILGQIYTKLPQTVGRPDSVIRDLDKAEEYLRQAVRIDPDYPENHIFLAETLLAKDMFSEAQGELTIAAELVPLWRNEKTLNSWQVAIKDLRQKIEKQNR